MFEGLFKILENAQRLDEKEAFRLAVDEDVKKLIIHLNTIIQLGEDGIDSENDSLGDYSFFTIQKKSTEGVGIGRIVDHVTFYDTGKYWGSWTVDVVGDEIQIKVDKDRFDELTDDLNFSDTHVGLTDENINKLAERMLPKYRDYAIRKIFK